VWWVLVVFLVILVLVGFGLVVFLCGLVFLRLWSNMDDVQGSIELLSLQSLVYYRNLFLVLVWVFVFLLCCVLCLWFQLCRFCVGVVLFGGVYLGCFIFFY